MWPRFGTGYSVGSRRPNLRLDCRQQAFPSATAADAVRPAGALLGMPCPIREQLGPDKLADPNLPAACAGGLDVIMAWCRMRTDLMAIGTADGRAEVQIREGCSHWNEA